MEKVKKKINWYLYVVSGLFILIVIFGVINFVTMQKRANEVRFVPIGDSYTIGEGVNTSESFPVLLTKNLQKENIPIELIINPSQTGYTTEDVITYELPIFEEAKPNFATLLIGANDVAQQIDKETFQRRLQTILDSMISVLESKDRLIILTIPDFSVTEIGKQYGANLPLSENVKAFNDVIKAEAKTRGVTVVDITPLTQKMTPGSDLVSSDGLHPSAKEYQLWEKEIYKKAVEVLK